MPPQAVQLFSNMGQQGPFSEQINTPLQPRPIDRPLSPMTGYEGTGTGLGKIALQFLQGIRGNRVASFLEQEKNNQMALDNYQAFARAAAQNPDLTDEQVQAIAKEANDTINHHMHYEMRDVPKGGVAGFFKNIFTMLSGGPIKTREPINWEAATGRLAAITGGATQSKNYAWGVAAARDRIKQLREAQGGVVLPSQLDNDELLANINQQIRVSAPQFYEQYRGDLQRMAPNPVEEEVTQQMLSGLRGGRAASPAVPTPLPPVSDNSVESTLQQHLGMVVPGLQPAPVRPADISQPEPAARSGLAALDLRSPVAPLILKRFGLEMPKVTTVYDPNDRTKAFTNAARHPFTRRLVNMETGQDLPEAAQHYVPENELSTLQRNPETNFDFRRPDNTVVSVRMRLNSEGNYEPVAISGVPALNLQGWELIGPTQIPIAVGEQGIITPRTEGYGKPSATPKETPGAAASRATDRKAADLFGKAVAAYPNDIESQIRYIAGARESNEIKGEAAKLAGRPPAGSEAERLFKALFGQQPAAAAAQPAQMPAQQPVAVATPAAAVPAGGARGLKRLQ